MSKNLSVLFFSNRFLNLNKHFKMSADLSDMRKPYQDKSKAIKSEKDLLPNPFEQFEQWFQTAKENAGKNAEINAVCLSTATKDGKPSSRMVLLKNYDQNKGFSIFTNYQSRKGQEIEQNSNVALLFYWEYPQRQVRIEGRAHKTPAEVSDKYFSRRPRQSQLSALISHQSKPVDSRETLLKRQEEASQHHPEQIPRPDFWGGYYIVPKKFEFWQGQSDRLHDRFVYERNHSGENSWKIQRLEP